MKQYMSTFITNLIFNFPFMEIHEKHHKVPYKIELTSSLRFWSYILKFVLISNAKEVQTTSK